MAVTSLPAAFLGDAGNLFAGIPALALLFNSVFAFEKKSLWHRRRRRAYRDFWMRLVYEHEGLDSVSKAIREFEDTLATEYPRFGSMTEKHL